LCYSYATSRLSGMTEVDVGKLKELRRRRVLTMHELGKRSGVAYNTVWRLENGKTGAQPRTIRKLAKALGVEPEELVKVEGGDDA
jgi:transcriptional regulator with XRE-family HTH domain